MFLLITSRMRWVPASGAKVSPLLRTRSIFSSSPGEKVSIRSEGSERLIFWRSVQSSMLSSSGSISPRSLVESEVRLISSNPVEEVSAFASPSRVAAVFSLNGR